MASHSDALHDTFNKLFDISLHSKLRYEEWMPKSAWREGVFLIILFPVLLIQNELFEASENGDDLNIEKKSHLIFEFNRFMDYPQSLLIDVVTENYFGNYLKLLKRDMMEIKKGLLKNYKDKIISPYESSENNSGR